MAPHPDIALMNVAELPQERLSESDPDRSHASYALKSCCTGPFILFLNLLHLSQHGIMQGLESSLKGERHSCACRSYICAGGQGEMPALLRRH